MLAGHIGAGFALGRAERRVNVGVFVAAALLLDLILWPLILVGWESVTIPADFAVRHQPAFVFPYSHGLLGCSIWSAAAGLVAILAYAHLGMRRWAVGGLVSVAVFSHWFLDALVHIPELPLTGAHSGKVGFGLWQHMPIALGFESAITLLGLILFLDGSGISRNRSRALVLLTFLVLALTLIGMTVAPAPPSDKAMAASSWITLVVICGIVWWIGRGLNPKIA